MSSGTPCLSRWDQPNPKADLEAVSGTAASGSQMPGAAQETNSPPGGAGSEEDAPQGGVEMAAAMAAKINAMLMAKGKLKQLEPLPSKIPPAAPAPTGPEEVVVTEVDINDVPINCRNLLTKGKTQDEIRQHSGAVVTTKGLYMTNADKTSAKGERPLYLHVQGRSQEEVNKAVQRIKEIISEDVMRMAAASGGQQRPVMPMLPVYPQPPRPALPQQPLRPQMPSTRPPNAQHNHRSHGGHSGSFCHTKIFVGLVESLPSFNVNEKVEGPGGTYLGHIQTETGARVFLRGKGSGYIEQASRRESFEPLYVYISHPNQAGLDAAKKLTESLLETQQWLSKPPGHENQAKVRAEHARMVSIYTATGSTQAYPAHGYPANSNYSSQGSWYNYPANGYPGGYCAYPGATGYWSSANGHPSHSNLSTTPQSSQAMVQYPVCPRKPSPFFVQEPEDQGSSSSQASASGTPSPPGSSSPKDHSVDEPKPDSDSKTEMNADEKPGEEKSSASNTEKSSERFLMPPPPPMPSRKRQRDSPPLPPAPPVPTSEEEPSPAPGPVEVPPKLLVLEDSSGLVPYGGDSSSEEEEEEEETHGSKMAKS